MDRPAAGVAFRAGFVALCGRPNAGKSTLLNAFLKQKLSIVSSVPQTTRHKILGILNGNGYQVCFLDTPGLLDAAKDGLQNALVRTARIAARDDADLIVLVVEPARPSEKDLEALKGLARGGRPPLSPSDGRHPGGQRPESPLGHSGAPAPPGRDVLVVVNKSDLVVDKGELAAAAEAYRAGLEPAEVHVISALRREGVDPLLNAILARLPESPAYFGADQASDRWERFFAEEIIRERIFEQYFAEVPHACAVQVEDFKEGGPVRVSAIVYVEREPQKGIVVGAKGKAIRRLTEEAERQLQTFLGRPVALELRVKVKRNWRKDPQALHQFGYQ